MTSWQVKQLSFRWFLNSREKFPNLTVCTEVTKCFCSFRTDSYQTRYNSNIIDLIILVHDLKHNTLIRLSIIPLVMWKETFPLEEDFSRRAGGATQTQYIQGK